MNGCSCRRIPCSEARYRRLTVPCVTLSLIALQQCIEQSTRTPLLDFEKSFWNGCCSVTRQPSVAFLVNYICRAGGSRLSGDSSPGHRPSCRTFRCCATPSWSIGGVASHGCVCVLHVSACLSAVLSCNVATRRKCASVFGLQLNANILFYSTTNELQLKLANLQPGFLCQT